MIFYDFKRVCRYVVEFITKSLQQLTKKGKKLLYLYHVAESTNCVHLIFMQIRVIIFITFWTAFLMLYFFSYFLFRSFFVLWIIKAWNWIQLYRIIQKKMNSAIWKKKKYYTSYNVFFSWWGELSVSTIVGVMKHAIISFLMSLYFDSFFFLRYF